MKVQKSQEFEQIRQAILNSEYVVDLPEKACLVLPGIDLLNLRKFKSVSEVQRVIESVRLVSNCLNCWTADLLALFYLSIPIFFYLILLDYVTLYIWKLFGQALLWINTR